MKKDEYIKIMNKINISKEAEQRILEKSIKINQNKRYFNMNKKKFIVIAAAAIMALGVTAFASSGLVSTWRASSSSNAEYKNLPSEEQCIKDVGFEPNLIESFDNGYLFDSGSVVKNSVDNKTTKSELTENVKFKSVTFIYKKNGEEVIFSQYKKNSVNENDGEILLRYKDIDIYYTGYTAKFVSSDYKLTDDDITAQENGDIVFTYGADEVKEEEVKGISFSDDKLSYSLTQISGSLTKDDFAKMAKEIIGNN